MSFYRDQRLATLPHVPHVVSHRMYGTWTYRARQTTHHDAIVLLQHTVNRTKVHERAMGNRTIHQGPWRSSAPQRLYQLPHRNGLSEQKTHLRTRMSVATHLRRVYRIFRVDLVSSDGRPATTQYIEVRQALPIRVYSAGSPLDRVPPCVCQLEFKRFEIQFPLPRPTVVHPVAGLGVPRCWQLEVPAGGGYGEKTCW